jgi:hypothetical protein
VFAGAAAGALLSHAARAGREHQAITGLALSGLALAGIGFYTASRPALYPAASFWTSSPTYFAVRTGTMMAALGGLFALETLARVWPAPFRFLERFGRHSLFVYWIHVELVYGYATWLIHRRLPIAGTIVAYVAFCSLMYGALALQARVLAIWRGTQPNPLHLWYLDGLAKNR